MKYIDMRIMYENRYIYICLKNTDIYMQMYEIDRFTNNHPELFLQIGAPKMNAKSWMSACEELHFLQHYGL